MGSASFRQPIPCSSRLPRVPSSGGWTAAGLRRGVPGGAAPSYAHGYYDRDNAAYLEWEKISRDRETFTAWLRQLEAPVTRAMAQL